jgi:hypothetical protein
MDSTRAAVEEHWRASEWGDTEAEHAIYATERSSTTRSQVNVSEVARGLRSNVAGTPPIGTSRCYASLAVGICG